ncbi:uncharacterized protein BX663DRAFT_520386 [Cokeromyces recurvatus]|uniref:uncharacterized protein n=1 Tax=Cokeromyces recurvatus TaxID=90255 RepID=UPI00221FF1B2|nr:uncharacterized protein BX663DRAFT_520386 [Cokeromyces recurvatus]KAI7899774.1 hypothetical protein BX663DRAFT_520386 [Cokeromyces recurvatus]
MSLSPLPESPNKIKESPSRYRSRFSDRFQSISSLSPSHENTTTITNQQSFISPVHPTDNKKLIDNEKYSAFEIKNEDRGQWRESEIDTNDKNNQMMEEDDPTPVPTPVQQQQQQQQETVKKEQITQTVSDVNTRHRHVPHYMQATRSFYGKVSNKKESSLLGPRSKSGITKKVGASKIPRYRSTTQINAIEDIKNEMTLEDVYIPMAARIKLFEKGLGNNGSSNTLQRQKSSSSTASNSNDSSSKQQRPIKKTTQSPSESSQNSNTSSSQQKSKQLVVPSFHSSEPNYLRQTSSFAIKQKEIRAQKLQTRIEKATESHRRQQRVDQHHSVTQTKPFRFATSERAKHFKQKLDSWKAKDEGNYANTMTATKKRKVN